MRQRGRRSSTRVRCKDDPCCKGTTCWKMRTCRFVRARDGNVSKAEKMLRDHGQWRDDYGFPALLAAGKTPEDAFIEGGGPMALEARI